MRNLNLKELAQLLKEFAVGGRFLKQSPHWAPEQMRTWQLQKIQQLVAHASTHVPFYRDLYKDAGFELGDLKTWDDFERLPLVSKDDVIANYPDRMLRSGSQPDDCIVSRSSGSSGKVLDICYDSEAMVIYSLAGLRLYKMGFSYRPWHMQLYEDINYIELIEPDSDTGMGTLVGTNLHNYAMPMIRYVQNDLGTIQPSSCECGWQFRELSNLQGRKNDSFIMPSGKEISSGFLLDATYEILLT